MRVVVTGATGNVGTGVMESLAAEPRVDEVVAAARRAPGREFPRGAEELTRILRARPLKLSARVLRAAASATFSLRLHPSEPG